jgi:HK97 family phage prohead protease
MDSEQFFDALADVPNVRTAALEDIEIKDGGNVFLFDGYAVTFGQTALLGGGDFTEEVAPGAFRSVLAGGPNVPFLHEHAPDQLLATTKSGRLKLEEDGHGLRVRAKLVKTDLSTRVKALADSGDITGMSYGFVAGRGNQKIEQRDGRYHRLLTGFKKLLDVSTTWNPAYPNTEAQFRSKALEYADSPESWQRILMGAYPQLEDTGDDPAGTSGEDGVEHRTDSETPPGVDETLEQRRFEAAKRRLSFIELTGGYDNAS